MADIRREIESLVNRLYFERRRLVRRPLPSTPRPPIPSGARPHQELASELDAASAGAFSRCRRPGSGRPDDERWGRQRDTRRGHPRYTVDVEATVTLDSGLRVWARTRDLSRSRHLRHHRRVAARGRDRRASSWSWRSATTPSPSRCTSTRASSGARPSPDPSRWARCSTTSPSEQDDFLEMFLHLPGRHAWPRGGGRQDDEDESTIRCPGPTRPTTRSNRSASASRPAAGSRPRCARRRARR